MCKLNRIYLKRILKLGMAVVSVAALCGCGSNVSDSNTSVAVSEQSESVEVSPDNSKNEASAENGAVEVKEEATETKIDNPLAGLSVIYPGKMGEDDNDTASLVEFFMANTGTEASEILMANVNDYDNDGNSEAFIFVGTKLNDGYAMYEGNMWYTNGIRTQKLTDDDNYGWALIDGVLSFDGRTYAFANEYYTTGGPSTIWSVYDGEAKEDMISGAGSVWQNGDNEFTVMDSRYDATYDPEIGSLIGHTWKRYYFGYDKENDEVFEYGADMISLDQIDTVSGTDITAQIEEIGGQIFAAYYRMNGILNVNYRLDEGNGSYTYSNANYDCNKGEFLDVWNNGEHTVKGSDFGGIYEAAHNPEFAKYPAANRSEQTAVVKVASEKDIVPLFENVIILGTDEEGNYNSYVVDIETQPEGELMDCDYPVAWMQECVANGALSEVVGTYEITSTLGHADKLVRK